MRNGQWIGSFVIVRGNGSLSESGRCLKLTVGQFASPSHAHCYCDSITDRGGTRQWRPFRTPAGSVMSTPATMTVALLDWRPMIRGALRGSATVQLGRSLKITDVPVLCSNGKFWVLMPGKPLIADGKVFLDDRGRQRYVQVLGWTDKTTAERFSAAVIAAVRREHGLEMSA
jgi:hypothetical protein